METMDDIRNKEWEKHVESHKAHCAQYRDASTLDSKEVQAIVDAVVKNIATDEEVLKLARYLAYDCVDDLTDELVEAGVKICVAVEKLDVALCKDMKTSICINATKLKLCCDSLIKEDLNELVDWADVPEVRDYIYNNCDDEVLKENALNGNQWAFDVLCYNGLECCVDNEDYILFCIECKEKGIDIYDTLGGLDDSIEYDESIVELLASLQAYDFLEEHELATYSWIEDSLDGNDIVAEIAEEHLDKVFEYEEDFQWLKKKADAKVPQAQYLLGLLYLPNDLGIVNENKSLALRYLKAAKEGGCELAGKKIEALEAEEQKEKEEKQKKLQAEKEERLRQKQAEKECAESVKANIQKAENGELGIEEVVELAYWLSTGTSPVGIKKDAKKSTKLYRIAAKAGNTEAMYQLGRRMIEGEGCRKNWNAGIQYIRKAAKANHVRAQHFIKREDTFVNRVLHKFIK